MAPEIIVALISSGLTAVVGPLAVYIVKDKLSKKKADILHQELQLSNIVQDKLTEIQKKFGVDRIWITQFHNGGHFYPTGKSIQKFSIIYEATSTNAGSIQHNFQNIPINLFSKSINYVLENNMLCIPDFKDETKPTYGLRYLAEETGCKSAYEFALRNISGKFIGVVGIDYVKSKKNLSHEQLEEIQYTIAALGGLIGDNLPSSL
jgi:hypothetical protein